MPEEHMLEWLLALDVGVESRTETELVASNGWRFVRSENGYAQVGNAWVRRYLWSRV